MTRTLDRLSKLVTVRPYITLIVLLLITVVLAAGADRRAPPTEGADVAFLPPGHPIANATQDIDELFGDSSEISVVTLVFRGEALTPGGLAQMTSLVDDIVSDPSVGELLAPTNPIVTPALLINAVLQVESFESISQAEIDSVRSVPEIQGALAAMTGIDTDGTPDWIDDTGEPGDKYDPELAALLEEASAGVELDPVMMQEFLDELVAREPDLAHLLNNDPEGTDAMLLQFPTYLGNPEQIRMIQEEIEVLWLGDDSAVTVTSGSIVSIAVTDQIKGGQTEAISTTIAMALGILSVFFWVTLRQPALGFVAVGPIVLVLISVLGTMALLGIPYTVVTSIITALSIGIGVDYTIHVIHRYREEFSRLRNPERAAIRTLATTGSALLGSALTTAFGFGVLIASPLLASQRFGITATITIVYSLIVSVTVVLPAMVVWGAYQNMRLRSMVERMWNELDEAIEGVHRRHEEGTDAS